MGGRSGIPCGSILILALSRQKECVFRGKASPRWVSEDDTGSGGSFWRREMYAWICCDGEAGDSAWDVGVIGKLGGEFEW